MELIPISDPRFRRYGRELTDFHLGEFSKVLHDTVPLPERGTVYEPSCPALESLPAAKTLREKGFGGLNIQIGWCAGFNSRLTCLEYHRTSEIDLAGDDLILLLAHLWEVEEGALDTRAVTAFFVPAGSAVELYATTLHYAPCGNGKNTGFRMGCALPKGTNLPAPDASGEHGEARLLFGVNKWVIAGEGTEEAAHGAFVGLHGPAIELF